MLTEHFPFLREGFGEFPYVICVTSGERFVVVPLPQTAPGSLGKSPIAAGFDLGNEKRACAPLEGSDLCPFSPPEKLLPFLPELQGRVQETETGQDTVHSSPHPIPHHRGFFEDLPVIPHRPFCV